MGMRNGNEEWKWRNGNDVMEIHLCTLHGAA